MPVFRPQDSAVDADDGSSALHIAALHVFPVKSCAGVAVPEARLAVTGLERDRHWMVVDDAGAFVTQRELARMALVQVAITPSGLQLMAPGVAPLDVAPPPAGPPVVTVRVWQDAVTAREAPAAAHAWLSAVLQRPVRLVHFDPANRRLSSARWTGAVQAPNAFSDGYPVLVIGEGSLAALNERLAARGQAPVEMRRFRPNVVLGGLEPHAEDWLDELRFDTPEGSVVLRLVKPCSRCPIPNIDPATAERGHEPGDTLASYRADPRLDGAVTFGMNAVIVEGVGRTLRVGLAGRGTVAF